MHILVERELVQRRHGSTNSSEFGLKNPHIVVYINSVLQ